MSYLNTQCISCPQTTTLQPNAVLKSAINVAGPNDGGVKKPIITCPSTQQAYIGGADSGDGKTTYEFFTCASSADEAYNTFQLASQNAPNSYIFQGNELRYFPGPNGYQENACLYGSGPVAALQWNVIWNPQK